MIECNDIISDCQNEITDITESIITFFKKGCDANMEKIEAFYNVENSSISPKVDNKKKNNHKKLENVIERPSADNSIFGLRDSWTEELRSQLLKENQPSIVF